MTTEASFAGADVGLTAADSGWRSRATRIAPWALGLLCAVLVAGGFSLGLRLGNLHNGLIAATFTAVGVFVVIRRRGNREGWLFIATGLAHAVMFFGRQYGLYASDGRDALPGAEWVA
jgi:hypothetical protein